MSNPNSSPFLPGPYRSVNASFATANTDQSGATGTVATIYTAATAANGGQGSYIRDVDIFIPVTSAAGVVVFLVSDGTTLVAVKSVLIPAVTVSATVSGYWVRVPLDLYLPAGGILKALTTVAQITHARTTLADY